MRLDCRDDFSTSTGRAVAIPRKPDGNRFCARYAALVGAALASFRANSTALATPSLRATAFTRSRPVPSLCRGDDLGVVTERASPPMTEVRESLTALPVA